MAEIFERPTMELEPDLEPERAMVLRSIDRAVHNRPRAFVAAIEALQTDENGLQLESLNRNEARAAESRLTEPGKSALPQAMVSEVLRLRYDADYEYDSATESAIKQDAPGVPRNEKARTKLRLDRLRIYAARIADYNDVKKHHNHPHTDRNNLRTVS